MIHIEHRSRLTEENRQVISCSMICTFFQGHWRLTNYFFFPLLSYNKTSRVLLSYNTTGRVMLSYNTTGRVMLSYNTTGRVMLSYNTTGHVMLSYNTM